MTTTYELGPDETPTDGVFEAISMADERSVLDLPPLGDTVDPDALDALLVPDAGTRKVTFEYACWLVTATSDGIYVEPADDA